MNKLKGWLLLTLLTSATVVYAQQEGPLASTNFSAETVKQGMNVASMMVGCELDSECLMSTLEEIVKTDPNVVYTSVLSNLKSQQEKIEFNALHCRNDDTQSVRKALTQCLSKALPERGRASAEMAPRQQAKLQQSLNSCIKERLEGLSEQGNIFAQSTLVTFAQRNNDQASVAKWSQMIESQTGTAQYENLQQCVDQGSPLDLLNLFTLSND